MLLSPTKRLPLLITIMVVKCYSHVIIPLNRIELDRNSILQYYLLLVLEDLRNAVKNDDEDRIWLNIYTRLNVLAHEHTCIYCKTIFCPILFYFEMSIAAVIIGVYVKRYSKQNT